MFELECTQIFGFGILKVRKKCLNLILETHTNPKFVERDIHFSLLFILVHPGVYKPACCTACPLWEAGESHVLSFLSSVCTLLPWWCHAYDAGVFCVGQTVRLPPDTTVLRLHHLRTGRPHSSFNMFGSFLTQIIFSIYDCSVFKYLSIFMYLSLKHKMCFMFY